MCSVIMVFSEVCIETEINQIKSLHESQTFDSCLWWFVMHVFEQDCISLKSDLVILCALTASLNNQGSWCRSVSVLDQIRYRNREILEHSASCCVCFQIYLFPTLYITSVHLIVCSIFLDYISQLYTLLFVVYRNFRTLFFFFFLSSDVSIS